MMLESDEPTLAGATMREWEKRRAARIMPSSSATNAAHFMGWDSDPLLALLECIAVALETPGGEAMSDAHPDTATPDMPRMVRDVAEAILRDRDALKRKLDHALEGLAHPYPECRCPKPSVSVRVQEAPNEADVPDDMRNKL